MIICSSSWWRQWQRQWRQWRKRRIIRRRVTWKFGDFGDSWIRVCGYVRLSIILCAYSLLSPARVKRQLPIRMCTYQRGWDSPRAACWRACRRSAARRRSGCSGGCCSSGHLADKHDLNSKIFAPNLFILFFELTYSPNKSNLNP